ncbi:hypothetical protein DSCO28_57750 [Desulfosarcina ovata subsp. sediminis]|uniref:Uncharacterized protein n=1 Tax=Desulfosarcina ovata subsp. sediminis TaxID=885957 RepID=A0A5K7ZY62_9BACT|nr:hypothetical protein DSCO28_57750 [Desulfosarcina ovata subsp. sediminis]
MTWLSSEFRIIVGPGIYPEPFGDKNNRRVFTYDQAKAILITAEELIKEGVFKAGK